MHGFGKWEWNSSMSGSRGRYPSNCSQQLFVIDMDKLSRQTRKSKGHGDGDAEPDDHIENAHSGSSSSAAYSNSDSQPEGYDPNRIPASIFGNRPANPGEWSVASNESLFSLHIANGSLSRENFLMLYKSGELGRLDDPAVIKPGNLLKPPPEPQPELEPNKLPRSTAQDQVRGYSRSSSHFYPSLSPVTEADHNMHKISEQMEKHSNLTDHAANAAAQNPQATSPSADSVNSNKSFAFPEFERDEVTNKSINMKIAKAESEKQQQQATSEPQEQDPQSEKRQQLKAPKTRPKSDGSSWFSCFPCFSQCNVTGSN